ncbi:hypothetical protein F511_12012 [Dorcoceras hygrometricum]|uniref:Uncharacterized protein n=1 Tax=Dorcoceras hygrometricum TaxID=472368 RepID=A0A2Z7ACY7_9LAMI|nr:hypothetical protein F511_12012 [Dorcoceras hygrometricum]
MSRAMYTGSTDVHPLLMEAITTSSELHRSGGRTAAAAINEFCARHKAARRRDRRASSRTLRPTAIGQPLTSATICTHRLGRQPHTGCATYCAQQQPPLRGPSRDLRATERAHARGERGGSAAAHGGGRQQRLKRFLFDFNLKFKIRYNMAVIVLTRSENLALIPLLGTAADPDHASRRGSGRTKFWPGDDQYDSIKQKAITFIERLDDYLAGNSCLAPTGITRTLALHDVCIAIGSLATLDLSMVVDLIGIYVLKGPYCTLTTTNWSCRHYQWIPARKLSSMC